MIFLVVCFQVTLYSSSLTPNLTAQRNTFIWLWLLQMWLSHQTVQTLQEQEERKSSVDYGARKLKEPTVSAQTKVTEGVTLDFFMGKSAQDQTLKIFKSTLHSRGCPCASHVVCTAEWLSGTQGFQGETTPVSLCRPRIPSIPVNPAPNNCSRLHTRGFPWELIAWWLQETTNK